MLHSAGTHGTLVLTHFGLRYGFDAASGGPCYAVPALGSSRVSAAVDVTHSSASPVIRTRAVCKREQAIRSGTNHAGSVVGCAVTSLRKLSVLQDYAAW
jgi:hypothetical protein